MSSPAALRIVNLSKTFPGQQALDQVDLEITAGEIHALVGANGSGKSTIVKILAGYHEPDAGARAEVGDVPFELGSATAALDAGTALRAPGPRPRRVDDRVGQLPDESSDAQSVAAQAQWRAACR